MVFGNRDSNHAAVDGILVDIDMGLRSANPWVKPLILGVDEDWYSRRR